MPRFEEIAFVIDEDLLRLGKGVMAVRHDTARFSEHPVDELLPAGILDTEWIPVVAERGWIAITTDRKIRTKPREATLAIQHGLKVVHLHKVGHTLAWDQLMRLTQHWDAVMKHTITNPEGPWWLSLRPRQVRSMRYEPGAIER